MLKLQCPKKKGKAGEMVFTKNNPSCSSIFQHLDCKAPNGDERHTVANIFLFSCHTLCKNAHEILLGTGLKSKQTMC